MFNGKLNGKGTNVTLWVFGVVLFPTLFFIGNNVIKNDIASRQRDLDIQKEAVEVERRTNDCFKEVAATQTEILIAIGKIQSKMGIE
jgi:hypothetical protein